MLPNISRTKGNQTMKVGQLIKDNTRNIFLENHTQIVVEKLVLDPFVETQKFSMPLDHQSEMLYGLFLFYVQVEVY